MEGWQLVFKETTESTNEDAKELIRERPDCAGTIIWAAEQTRGKGRYDRMWSSPKGNLYCSFVVPNENTGFISFACALAVIDALKEKGIDASISCKWPNDVLVDGKKISGILLEVCENMLIIGIGANIKSCPATSSYATGSLADFGLMVEAGDFLTVLALYLRKNLDLLEDGFVKVRGKWLAHAHNLGGKIKVNLINESTEGVFQGISEQGALLLETADGKIKNIMAGDVFYL